MDSAALSNLQVLQSELIKNMLNTNAIVMQTAEGNLISVPNNMNLAGVGSGIGTGISVPAAAGPCVLQDPSTQV